MSFRGHLLSVQIHGRIDWINLEQGLAGMYLRTSSRGQTKCVLMGPSVKDLLDSHALGNGMIVSAFGQLSARLVTQNGEPGPQVLCRVDRLLAEPPLHKPPPGALYANVKGAVMHWDPVHRQIKTYLNKGEHGQEEQVTCTVYLQRWLAKMPPQSAANLEAMIRVGREYTLTGMIEAGCYTGKSGIAQPSLALSPLDFRMQG